MSHKAAKIGITSAVLALAFGALMFTSLNENLQYYKFVDEVMAEPQAWEGKPLRIHGYVVPDTILRKASTREYYFDVQHNGKRVKAYFVGTPPDAFKNDSEVVLTGILRGERFVADDIQAKCPSKYEEGGTKSPKIVARAD